MDLTDGELVSKSGAEGIQCIGRDRRRPGVAIKVVDGFEASPPKKRYATAIFTLRQDGLDSALRSRRSGGNLHGAGAVQASRCSRGELPLMY